MRICTVFAGARKGCRRLYLDFEGNSTASTWPAPCNFIPTHVIDRTAAPHLRHIYDAPPQHQTVAASVVCWLGQRQASANIPSVSEPPISNLRSRSPCESEVLVLRATSTDVFPSRDTLALRASICSGYSYPQETLQSLFRVVDMLAQCSLDDRLQNAARRLAR
ncbi:hypothetical protein V496_05762 [Pseudogymnoascus sp. VKM F-4515 (FW-2607)]|nr:hypothetical protein V496_05762 [Pseudogymnoascus sp. VKM F-4515 (FW-2607)]